MERSWKHYKDVEPSEYLDVAASVGYQLTWLIFFCYGYMPQKKLMVLRHTPLASHFANSGHIFVDPGNAEENRVSYIPRLKR